MADMTQIATATAGLPFRRFCGQPEYNFARCSLSMPAAAARAIHRSYRDAVGSDLLELWTGIPEGMIKSAKGRGILQDLLTSCAGHFRISLADKRISLFRLLYDHVFADLDARCPALVQSRFRSWVVLTLYERSLGYDSEPPASLEELVEAMERYCRDWDTSESSTLFSIYENDTPAMYRGRLQDLGGELNREFGSAEPVMFAGQAGLTRDLLLRSLAVHVRAWDRRATTTEVVTEDCEPGRKLEWETRKSGGVGSELERMGAVARPVRRDDEERADITLASLIAETALACCGFDWDGRRNVNPLPPEDTAALRQLLKEAWVGARQLPSWKLLDRLWELERVNAPLLRALALRDGSLRDALADLRAVVEEVA